MESDSFPPITEQKAHLGNTLETVSSCEKHIFVSPKGDKSGTVSANSCVPRCACFSCFYFFTLLEKLRVLATLLVYCSAPVLYDKNSTSAGLQIICISGTVF